MSIATSRQSHAKSGTMYRMDRELLEDIGFELGTGWDVEVWVYQGKFWVYLEDSSSRWKSDTTILLSDHPTRKDFFSKFLGELENMSFEYWAGRD